MHTSSGQTDLRIVIGNKWSWMTNGLLLRMRTESAFHQEQQEVLFGANDAGRKDRSVMTWVLTNGLLKPAEVTNWFLSCSWWRNKPTA